MQQTPLLLLLLTDRTAVNTGNEYQLDMVSASKIKVPFYLIAAHEKTQPDNPARSPNQFSNAVVDNVDVKRDFVGLMVLDVQRIQSKQNTQKTNI